MEKTVVFLHEQGEYYKLYLKINYKFCIIYILNVQSLIFK